MNPKVGYPLCKVFMMCTGKLLHVLDSIVPAAAVVAQGQKLDGDRQRQLDKDFGKMMGYKRVLDLLQSGLSGEDSQEALFVRTAIGGGLNNLLATFYGFASMPDDPEFAGGITRQMLHPYRRLYHDLHSLRMPNITITIDGDDEKKAQFYYEKAPFPASDVAGISKAVYGSIFSAILSSSSLNFTACTENGTGFIKVEAEDEEAATGLLGVINRSEIRSIFLNETLAAGIRACGATIIVPFQVA